jgi:hypothetical protein
MLTPVTLALLGLAALERCRAVAKR